MFSTGAFENPEEAYAFGTNLLAALKVVGCATRIGIDVGDETQNSWVNEEWAASSGMVQAGHRIVQNIHGVSVFPDDSKNVIPIILAEGRVTHDPVQITSAIEELSTSVIAFSSRSSAMMRTFNYALLNSDPVARIILSISVVEDLGQSDKWSDAQLDVIHSLSQTKIRTETLSAEEKNEISTALERLSISKLSVRQGVLRALERFGCGDLRAEWDRVYGLRSKLVHGAEPMPHSEIGKLATDAVSLVGRILMNVLAYEGLSVPSVSRLHYADAIPHA